MAVDHKKRASSATAEGYIIRPNYQKKFRPMVIKEHVHEVLVEELADKDYDPKQVDSLANHISDAVRAKLKGLDLDRYKFIVQIVIAEQRGQGAKMQSKCHWDSDTDNFTSDVFINNSLICCASVFGIFHY